MRYASTVLAALFAVGMLAAPAFADCAGHQQTAKNEAPMTPAPSTTQSGEQKSTVKTEQTTSSGEKKS